MCKVEISGVSFAYGNNNVLKDITFVVDQGDFIAVIGPNGAGKSTMLKIMAGILRPNEGAVSIAGYTVNDARRKGLVGYVPQNYGQNVAGFPANVEEVVRLGLVRPFGKARGGRSAEEHIVHHMLELVGCSSLKNCRIGELSGGQLQRVMVARALAANPQLLLLDEPTSGIDFDASTKIYELLGKLNRNLGITVVMISHDIQKAIEYVNKVACINNGLCFYGPSCEFNTTHILNSHTRSSLG